jgi:hypothetical protein
MLRSYLIALPAALLIAGCATDTRAPQTETPAPTATLADAAEQESSATRVVMYKSPQCGCCVHWADHLASTGRFEVTARDVANLSGVKEHLGVPPSLGSCHTAEVDGYVVEGHVPAREVIRLLDERPEGIVGLAVPGMPIGSPGMEVPGRAADSYDVIAIRTDGSTEVYASY